jgi:hypothetical protein
VWMIHREIMEGRKSNCPHRATHPLILWLISPHYTSARQPGRQIMINNDTQILQSVLMYLWYYGLIPYEHLFVVCDTNRVISNVSCPFFCLKSVWEVQVHHQHGMVRRVSGAVTSLNFICTLIWAAERWKFDFGMKILEWKEKNCSCKYLSCCEFMNSLTGYHLIGMASYSGGIDFESRLGPLSWSSVLFVNCRESAFMYTSWRLSSVYSQFIVVELPSCFVLGNSGN